MSRRYLAVALLVVLVLVIVPLGGCVSKTPKGGDIVGRWQPTKITGDVQAVPGTWIEFGADGRVNGFSGVNTFVGQYAAKDDGSLDLGPLASTQKAGAPAAMQGEQAFLGALDQVASYRAADGKLTLYSDADKVVGEFEPAKTAGLTDSEWVLTGHNNGKDAVVTSAISGNITVKFNEDGTLEGKSGCGTYTATYTVDAQAISISVPKGVKTAPCPVDYAAQREEYLAALPKAAMFEISSAPGAGGVVPTLQIRDGKGSLLASFETTVAK